MTNTTALILADVSSTETADLLAFFNANSGLAPVARFADRANAVRRVSSLIQTLDAARAAAEVKKSVAKRAASVVANLEAAAKKAPKTTPAEREAYKAEAKRLSAERAAAKKAAKPAKAVYVANSNVCPKCGQTEDQTRAGLEGEKGEDRNFCHCCSTEYFPETGKVYNAPAASASRSAAIAQSWTDPTIAAARAERNHVVVNKVQYRSVLQAFQELGLPVAKHIAFRGQLKASEGGKLAFNGIVFKLVPAAE